MSEFNIREWYDRYVEALNAHEFDRAGEFAADGILSHGQPATRADLVEALKGMVDAVPDLHWEIKKIVVHAETGTVSTYSVNHGTPTKEWLGVAPTGKKVEVDEIAMYKIRDGKFVQMSNVHDVEALKKQLAG